MQFIKLQEEGVLPDRKTTSSAGYILRSIEAKILLPNDAHLFHTGIAWKKEGTGEWLFDDDSVGIIKPRQSLARRYFIDVLGGVIGSDYTDEIMVILVNHGEKAAEIRRGDKIAQLIILDYSSEADSLAEKVERI